MPFERILVAIDGSDASNRAFAKALELAGSTRAQLTAPAIEGPLPAYAATIGEVEEVKREKHIFFNALAVRARQQAKEAGVELEVELRAGHAAEAISDFAGAVATTSWCSDTGGIFCATICSAPRPIASPSTLPAR